MAISAPAVRGAVIVPLTPDFQLSTPVLMALIITKFKADGSLRTPGLRLVLSMWVLLYFGGWGYDC